MICLSNCLVRTRQAHARDQRRTRVHGAQFIKAGCMSPVMTDEKMSNTKKAYILFGHNQPRRLSQCNIGKRRRTIFYLRIICIPARPAAMLMDAYRSRCVLHAEYHSVQYLLLTMDDRALASRTCPRFAAACLATGVHCLSVKLVPP